MAWKRLDIDDLKTILSQDEIDRLDSLSLDEDVTDVVNKGIDLVSDAWRGALGAKGYTLDVRDHYTPPEYTYWILVHARWAVWTRFPNAPQYALDDARKAEYEKALELLQKPYLDTSDPDYSQDPELSSATIPEQTGSIFTPPMRFNPWWTGGYACSVLEH